jgi:hypothetical protein
MPARGLGYLSGKLNLTAPADGVRPFSPGEYLTHPEGDWSNEMSVVIPHPTAPGKFTIAPSLWLDNNRAVRIPEDKIPEYAQRAGIQLPTWNTAEEADAVSQEREKNWQGIRPEDSAKIQALWSLLK